MRLGAAEKRYIHMGKVKIEQVFGMLLLQDKMNAIINPDWINAGYPFLRAVVVEVGEALDHFGWKWWKKQAPDIAQVQIELIDILHFMLSQTLVDARGVHKIAAHRIVEDLNRDLCDIEFDGKHHILKTSDTRILLELLAGLAVSRRNAFPVLEACFTSCDMTWDSVTQQYLYKNVLNIFRQNNGYKDGTYLKEWGGKEDNFYLVEIAKGMDVSTLTFADDLYTALERQYAIEVQRAKSAGGQLEQE